jgi:trehalose 2-sulfotransferase
MMVGSMVRPSTGVLLCSLPRVGSTLFCELLQSTGVVGYPGEWFLYPERERLWRKWGVKSHDEYLDRVLTQGTSPNGVFATKLMWGHLGEFLLYVRRACDDFVSSDLTAIEALLPAPRFVWLRRHDTVAQAVSWAKAVQTGQWRTGLGGDREPAYDFAQIEWIVHQIQVWDAAWDRWFRAQGVEPEVVWYEDLSANPLKVVEHVLAYLRLETPAGAAVVPASDLRKQADAVNEQWIARYLADSRLRQSPYARAVARS